MSSKTVQGLLEIDLVEFWEWVLDNHFAGEEVVFGVPTINRSNETIEITFASSDTVDPRGTPAGEAILAQWKAWHHCW